MPQISATAVSRGVAGAIRESMNKDWSHLDNSCHVILVIGLNMDTITIPGNGEPGTKVTKLLSCQPRVTVTSCFVYNVISDL